MRLARCCPRLEREIPFESDRWASFEPESLDLLPSVSLLSKVRAMVRSPRRVLFRLLSFGWGAAISPFSNSEQPGEKAFSYGNLCSSPLIVSSISAGVAEMDAG